MNSFGRLFRISIFGESHGPSAGILVDGCPSGIPLDADDMSADLKRRQGGKAGTTQRVEDDRPCFLSGTFEGKTTGAPILAVFDNTRQDSGAYEALRYTPRPGHADFTAFKKYGGFNDHRGGGHLSGRLTVGLVAAGVIAKKIIAPLTIDANLIEAGGSSDPYRTVRETAGESDSIGGIVECRAQGVPAGLGEPFFDSLESLLSHAVFSIPAIKGIEFGAGFAAAKMPGSICNDEIVDAAGGTATNNAGGIAGGITSGNELTFRVAVKPTPSIGKPQGTIDVRDGRRVSISVEGRHDRCIALRVPVIIEAVCAIVLADCMLMEQMTARVRAQTPIHCLEPKEHERIQNGTNSAKALDGLIYDAIAKIPDTAIFHESTVTQLESITSRLEHLKHIIRDKDEEELRFFFAKTGRPR